MKKSLLFILCSFFFMSSFAQETYENANLVTEDLNGTARYVGMGGAMEALGADMSVIGTNPAGIGMFRRSQVSLTGGVVTQPSAPSSSYVGGANASFDQAGGVFSARIGDRYLNFAFNYKKSRNFDNILGVSSLLNGASQNKLTYMKAYEGLFTSYDNTYNQVDYLYENAVLYDQDTQTWGWFAGGANNFKKSTKGYIGEYDFNISGNVNDRIYLGLTLGLKSVHYKAYTEYTEALVHGSTSIGDVSLTDERRITGSGFDVKFGAIIFPIENSAFRIGLNVATPTWYDLTTSNYTQIKNNIDEAYCSYGYNEGHNNEDYDYRVNTPWKFGASLGHTIGKFLAIGASYEFADYAHISTRIIGSTNAWGGNGSYKDDLMNENTKACLKGTHTMKIGVELKPIGNLAIRAGYNYVTPMYKMSGYRDGSINSPGTYYSSTTDYTNWKATNRFTFGAGYTFGKFGVDLAYQYQSTKGEFYPFMSYRNSSNPDMDNVAEAVNVKNQRHQVLLTLSYKF